jgi:nucleoside-diphosphate-sugar epimerase
MSLYPASEHQLDELLSEPTEAAVSATSTLDGDILILGAGGKMGPSLARLIRRASDTAETSRRVIAASRFTNPAHVVTLEAQGIEVFRGNLLDPAALGTLPDVDNVILMAGQKFGTAADPAATWATNVVLPGLVVQRYPRARIVVFSAGNVYGMSAVAGPGAREDAPLAPVGDYAESAVAREGVTQFLSTHAGTPVSIMRLNYAVELRYGVLRDLADRIVARQPIPLTMGAVNVIWQRDANSIAVQLLQHAASPPFVLNVTGAETLSVRSLAELLGRSMDIEPRFEGEEAPTALLSDASRCHAMFGPPSVDVSTMCDWVGRWVTHGGASLDKPTHFEERGGVF